MTIEQLEQAVKDYQTSEIYQWLLNGKRYYDGDHDIKKRERKDADGKVLENLPNSKLVHPFLWKIINQEVDFLMGRNFLVASGNKTLTDAFTDDLRDVIRQGVIESLSGGYAFLQVYFTSEGVLKFKVIPSEQIVPVWDDIYEKTTLESVIRAYITKKDDKDIKVMEYYSAEEVTTYVDDGSEWRQVESASHFIGEVDGDLYNFAWGRVPFVIFDLYGGKATLLQFIKPLIDNYDLIRSDMSNVISDVFYPFLVIKNIGGGTSTSEERTELRRKIMQERIAFVFENGGIDTLSLEMDVNIVEKHLEVLRRDIYDFAMAIDMQRIEMGNRSGQSLKFVFADLDIKSNSTAKKIEKAIRDMVWFIINGVEVDCSIVWNKDIIINEMEVIEMCQKSRSIISEHTILENHPWVNDVDKEKELIQKEGLEEYGGSDYNFKGGNGN